MPMFWYCKACPSEGECTTAAWKRGSFWGWSQEEVVDKVARHLHTSGLHQLRMEDAIDIAQAAEYLEEHKDTDDEADQQQQAAKRQRNRYDDKGKGTGQGIGQLALNAVAHQAASSVMQQMTCTQRINRRATANQNHTMFPKCGDESCHHHEHHHHHQHRRHFHHRRHHDDFHHGREYEHGLVAHSQIDIL